MTNLTESSTWESGVFQLETTTPVLGGTPGFSGGVPITGHANAQGQQLANRTTYLKTTIEQYQTDLANTSNDTLGASLIGYSGRSLSAKVGDFKNLLDFGTVDLTGVTDATSVFDTALLSGYPIYIPAGTIKATINLRNGSILIGSGKGKTIITPTGPAKSGAILSNNRHTIYLSDFTVDGTATVDTEEGQDLGLVHVDSGSYDVHLDNVEVKRSGQIGILFRDCIDTTANTRSTVRNCDIYLNKWQGLRISESKGIDILNNNIHNNRHMGFSIQPMTFPPATYGVEDVYISGNKMYENTGAGIYVLPLIKFGTGLGNGEFTYSHTSEQYCKNITVTENLVYGNVATGIMGGGYSCTYSNNISRDNGVSSSWAGIVFSAYGSTCTGNTCTGNATYGIDCGGSTHCVVSNNTIQYNAVGSDAIGLNLGASSHCIVTGNTIAYNGQDNANSTQLVIAGWDGDGVYAYTQIGGGNIIANNNIYCYPNNYGIRSHWQPRNNKISNNYIAQCSRENAIVIRTESSIANHVVNDNTHDFSMLNSGVNIASAATLVIDDYNQYFVVTGTTNITELRTKSQDVYYQKLSDGIMTATGSGYTSAPTVSLSGGGGTGGVLEAEISRNGTVVALKVVSLGSGYTSAPTVSFSGGGGTGAAATAVVGVRNNRQRQITLSFSAALTITLSGMATSFTTQAGSTLTLLGQPDGTWREISRTF